MNQFRVSNRLKAIKKTSSDLIGSFKIKRNQKLFESSFFMKLFYFFAFLSHLETSHFAYGGSVNDRPPLQSNEAQWTKKIVFKKLLMFF